MLYNKTAAVHYFSFLIRPGLIIFKTDFVPAFILLRTTNLFSKSRLATCLAWIYACLKRVSLP